MTPFSAAHSMASASARFHATSKNGPAGGLPRMATRSTAGSCR